jgi:hypothetical protein
MYSSFCIRCFDLRESQMVGTLSLCPAYSVVPCDKITRRANFRLTRRANHSYKIACLTRQEGRIAIVTNAGWDAVDAAASARRVIAGRAKTRERVNGAQDERRQSVRQNRVVLTPQRLASSLAEVRKAQPGRRASFREATETTKPDSPGRARHKP